MKKYYAALVVWTLLGLSSLFAQGYPYGYNPWGYAPMPVAPSYYVSPTYFGYYPVRPRYPVFVEPAAGAPATKGQNPQGSVQQVQYSLPNTGPLFPGQPMPMPMGNTPMGNSSLNTGPAQVQNFPPVPGVATQPSPLQPREPNKLQEKMIEKAKEAAKEVNPPAGTGTPGTLTPGTPLMYYDRQPGMEPDSGDGPIPFRTPGREVWYGQTSFLYWFTSDLETPVLFTGSPGIGGGKLELNNERLGGQMTLGAWLDDGQTWALETNYLYLAERNFNPSPTGPVITRPVDGLAPILAIPVNAGMAQVQIHQRLWGAEGLVRRELNRGNWGHFDFLLGTRYLQVDESLDINSTTTLPLVNLALSDQFETRNRFWGGSLGLDLELQWGRAYLDLWGKISLGANNQEWTIQGSSNLNGVDFNRGLLAGPGNMGTHDRTRFAALPEAGMTLGYRFSDHIRLGAGYQFLYLSNVLRPGGLIDTNVNPALVPARPAPVFNESFFWAQGINFNLEFRF